MNNLKTFKIFLESEISISDELFEYLKTTFKTGIIDIKDFEPKKWILVDEKMILLKNNKKYLVNKIYYEILDDWKNLDVSVIRKTIKTFLDTI